MVWHDYSIPVALPFVLLLQPLPWQRSFQEVHEDVGDGFQVVSAGQPDAPMVADGCVSWSAHQVRIGTEKGY